MNVHPLRAARLKKKLTQDVFALRVGVTKASVSAWENRLSNPEASRLAAIDDVLRPHLNLRAYLRDMAKAA